MNPLKLQATASAAAVEDPAHATIAKLIESIVSVATTVVPAKTSGAPAGGNPPGALPEVVAACSNATNDIVKLHGQLEGDAQLSTTVGSMIDNWVKAVEDAFDDGKSGPGAVRAGIAAINTDSNKIGDAIKNTGAAWIVIKDCAKTAPAAQRQAYLLASLSGQPAAVIQQLTSLKDATKQLTDLLKDFAAAERWMGPNKTDYRVSDEIKPTLEKMQNVTVKVVNVVLAAAQTSGTLSNTKQDAGSATFTVRRYSALAPEIGVGAVFGSVKQPKYGTATNAKGDTIVARVPDTSISINPSILVNFVCRCSTGALVPMIQMGAATSKDLPGILVGVGLRLFGIGKGDIAIGGGGMFSWVKDLQKLKPGGVVSGTKDIDADLGYSSRPKLGGYFVIQYKF